MKLIRLLAGIFVGAALLSASAYTQAAAVVGGAITVASDGDVIAKYIGNSASFSNDLYLDSPANGLGIIFNNQTSPIGSTVNLGFFTAGTELIFRLYVNQTGNNFFSGLASRNPDGKAHARVTNDYSPTETLVEFEDLFGTPEGDDGFNDLRFTFTNVQTAAVPEPATLAMWTGMLGVVCVFRKRRANVSRN